MKRFTIIYSCSYMVNNHSETSVYSFETADKDALFNELCEGAKIFSESKGGNVKIEKTENSLYINYLDVPNTNAIDRMYKCIDNRIKH